MGTKIQTIAKTVLKECSGCDRYLPLEEFGDNWNGKMGKSSKCYRCKRSAMYFRMYGVGVKYFEGRLKHQGNACALCKQLFVGNPYDPKVPHADRPLLDRDDVTESPRGVLCCACNTALAIIETRGEEWLERAGRYLEEYRDTVGYDDAVVEEEVS